MSCGGRRPRISLDDFAGMSVGALGAGHVRATFGLTSWKCWQYGTRTRAILVYEKAFASNDKGDTLSEAKDLHFPKPCGAGSNPAGHRLYASHEGAHG